MMRIFWHVNRRYIYSFFFSLTLILISCISKPQSGNSERIEAAIVSSRFPNYVKDSSNNAWHVVSYDSQFVKLHYYKTFSLLQVYHISETNKQLLGSPAKRFVYYTLVFDNSSSRAYRFDSTDLMKGEIILNKDSLLLLQPGLEFNADKIFADSKSELIYSQQLSNGDLEEKYALVGKTDTLMKGTLSLHFSKTKLQNFPYSLGPIQEKRKKMKLVGAMVITDGRYIQPGNYYLGRAEIPASIREIPVTPSEYKKLIKIFEYVIPLLQ